MGGSGAGSDVYPVLAVLVNNTFKPLLVFDGVNHNPVATRALDNDLNRKD